MDLFTSQVWNDLLARQSGVVSRRQAISHGFGEDLIENRLRSRTWRTLHRAVYATFTGPVGREAQLWAVVLRAGDGAALSHQTAAELLGLTDERSELIHVTVPGDRHPEPIRGARVHRYCRIEEVTHPAQLPPRTRVEETAIDLTQTAANLDDACGWLCRAVGRRLTTTARLRDAADSRPKLRWRSDLHVALADIRSGAHSLLEYLYIRDVERPHGLPRASRQARVITEARPRFLDNLYKEARLAVELDGQLAHGLEQRWDDMHRDNAHAGNYDPSLQLDRRNPSAMPGCAASSRGAAGPRHASRVAPMRPELRY